MIKAAELRIGNKLCRLNIGNVLTVSMIDESGSLYFLETPEHHWDLEEDQGIEGISLTTEWLEGMDWRDLGMGFFFPIGNGNPRRQLNWNVDFAVKIMDASGYVITVAENIQYVHQLQNLFFALTGEELTVS